MTRIFKNRINVKWLLLTIVIVITVGQGIATVEPIISNFHTYLDILHVNYLHGDISNATGKLPNASIPLSAMNYSHTRIKVGSFTRDISLASGTQSITGVGFKPVAIQFFANIGSAKQASWGMDDGTNRQSIITFDPTIADTWEQNNANSIFLMVTQDTNVSSANVTTFDNDGFTLTWTKMGSPTGTASIKYMAFR